MKNVTSRWRATAVVLLLGMVVTTACTDSDRTGPVPNPGGDTGGAAAPPHRPAHEPGSAVNGRPGIYSFVSMPDFLNQDVADLSQLPAWRPELGNSISDSYRRGLDLVLDDLAAHTDGDVLVAGDLVQGHWGLDPSRSGVFGPTGTLETRLAAVRSAGRIYYRQWSARFAARGLSVHAALGDHEIGDNSWDGSSRRKRFKRDAVPTYKAVWARHFTQTPSGSRRYRSHPPGPARNTAYAERLAPEVLLVTVDSFQSTRRNVRLAVDPQQLRWLNSTLAGARRAGIDWVMVQGHVPVLTPVRAESSSELSLARRERSPFWRTLRRHNVDLYLAGEVHATTARTQGRVTQISHGGLFYKGDASYLTGEVVGKRLRLTIRVFDGSAPPSDELWSNSLVRRQSEVVYEVGSRVVGTMTLRRDNTILARSGLLAPYRPAE